MSSDPTTSSSLDYLVELSDDANHPSEPETVELVIPPAPQFAETFAAPPSAAEPVTQVK